MEKVYLFGIPYEKLPSYRRAEPVGDKPVEERNSINFQLLDEIMEFIRLHPRTWKQTSWFAHIDPTDGKTLYSVEEETVTDSNACGSSFCFAGHVAIASGFPLPPLDNNLLWSRIVSASQGYYSEDVSEFAEKVLGLSSDQADTLFAGENTMDDLEWIVNVLHRLPDADGNVIEYYMSEMDADRFVDDYESLKNDFYNTY